MELPVPMMLLLDSRSPAGAHNHSGGAESAVTAGWVRDIDDLTRFCGGRLRTAGRVNAAFAAAATLLWQAGTGPERWHELDQAYEARTLAEATRRASRAMGSGLRRLLFATVPDEAESIRQKWAGCDRPGPHQPLVLGAGVALTGGNAEIAARAAATAVCVTATSAAVRLLGLDPYAAHTVTAALAVEIEAIADAAAETARGVQDFALLPADSAPALDLLADVHAISEVRLFAS
jgi:urease accessory protein